jgi:hypothetical protein
VGEQAQVLSYNALTSAGLLGVRGSVLRGAVQDGSLLSDPLPVSQSADAPRASVQYSWRAGDTLQGLALRAYGDASRWREIAEFNGLRGARWGDGRPLSVGDTLLVPRDPVDEVRGAAPESDPFGVDLRVDLATGDLVLRDNDTALSEGPANLAQALALRLLTEQGESWILPTYGLPLRVGGVGSPRESAYLAAQVSDQLRQDARVREVNSVEVLSEGDLVAVSVTFTPIAGSTTTITTPYIPRA